MKRMMSLAFAAILTCGLAAADDKLKEKHKIDGRDPVTGEKIKGKSKVKSESDGDYKEKTKMKVGDKKYKSKTKVDDGQLEKHKVEVK